MGQVIISKPFQKTQLVYYMCVFIYLYAHILKDKFIMNSYLYF